MKWLKLWDNIVFFNGKEIKKESNKNQKSHGTFTKQDGKFKRKEFVKSTFASRQALLEEDLVSIYTFTFGHNF